MKRKPKNLLIISGILIIIAIILGIILLSKNEKDKYDNSISESDRALLVLYKRNITNESKVSYEKGDRLNIILKASDIDYEYNKKPYMENVKVYEVSEDSISLWVPFEYKSFITAMQGSPLIKIELSLADNNEAFKVNKELYKLLEKQYSITQDKK